MFLENGVMVSEPGDPQSSGLPLKERGQNLFSSIFPSPHSSRSLKLQKHHEMPLRGGKQQEGAVVWLQPRHGCKQGHSPATVREWGKGGVMSPTWVALVCPSPGLLRLRLGESCAPWNDVTPGQSPWHAAAWIPARS